MKFLYYALLILTALANTTALALWKYGSEEVTMSNGIATFFKTSWKLSLGVLFFIIALILNTILNRKLDATIVYPIYSALTFLLLSIVMTIGLKKEEMTVLKVVAMFIITFGVILLSTQTKNTNL